MNVKLLDTTLREGEQTPGVSFRIEEKLKIAKMLDDFGIDMIEAGHPLVSEDVHKAVKKIANEGLKAEVLAHIRTLKPDIDAALDCNVDRIVLLLPTSDQRLNYQLKWTKEQAIRYLVESTEYALSHGVKVRFTPEDTTRTDFPFLIKICNAAVEAGADRISIADTLGIALPQEFHNFVNQIVKAVPKCEFDLHCHNDFGMAIANSLAGLDAGADCVHTCVNGLGERTGITDMATFVMSLKILKKMDIKWKTEKLPEISSYVEKASGLYIPANAPIVGHNAFSHKSGIHTDSILKNSSTFEHFSPEVAGRKRKIVIDRYTGKTAVSWKLKELGIDVSESDCLKIVSEIKNLGDERKIVHEADIINIAERVTGKKIVQVPKDVEALILIKISPHVYTSSVLRKIVRITGVKEAFEITGEDDIIARVYTKNITDLNNIIEEIRDISGVYQTVSKLLLKKYGEDNGAD